MDTFLQGEYKNFKLEYNEEQLNFINAPIENAKLLGIPGGGKTASIIGKIINHYGKRELKGNDNFLILTFSRRACLDFLEKGRRQNKILFNTRNIKTIHSLAAKILYKVLDKKSTSQDTIIISAIDLFNNHKDEIFEMNEFKNLKIIFVDEAQDISFIQYEFILKISQMTNCAVILIGDPNQNIYQFQNGSDQYLLNHTGKTYQLIKNYRSTPHLVNFINYFRPWDTLTNKMISTKPDDHHFNNKPVIINGTIDNVIDDIIEKILKSPFPKEEIAIIGPVKKCRPNSDSYTNIGLSLFANILSNNNIKFIKHYDDATNNEEVTNEVRRVKDHINLMTIHGSKGLEFHQVFLINFHTSTFGILPTEEKYKEFKYLWYVGLSRSAYDLNIYVDKNKMVWNELKKCPIDLYETNNKPKIVKDIKFSEEIQPIYYTVTNILNNKKIMSDETLFKLEKMLKYTINTIPIFTLEQTPIKNYKEYSVLYGMFIENIFNYYYSKKYSKKSELEIKTRKLINNTIILPKEYISAYKLLRIRIPNIKDHLITLGEINRYKNLFKKLEEDLFSYLCLILNGEYQKEFYIECYNEVSTYSKDFILKCLNKLDCNEENEIIKSIFNITLLYYQIDNETAYLWNNDFTEELNDLQIYINNIKDFINKSTEINDNFIIHPLLKHPKIDLIGELDILNDNKIIDIKFSNNLNFKQILQVFIYNMIVDPSLKKDMKIQIWNMQLGNIYEIELNRNEIELYDILKIISTKIGRKMKNMIFMYDLQTTGLSYANKKMDIIERHFEEYTTEIIASSGLIKPINVPFIPFQITKLTGITKDDVYEKGDNIEIFQNQIKDIMNYCYKPIFIAHNGNNFYNKIMTNNGLLSYYDCKLLDSRLIIRLFLDEQVSDKSLADIYQYLFKIKPQYQRSLTDIKMMREIFIKLNITEEKILNIVF